MAELAPDRLRRRCDPAGLGFSTTEEVAPLEGTLGQPRALEAIEFGLEIEAAGYNVFATGPIGTGKRSMLERHLGERAAGRPTPDDLVCVFDFEAPERPLVIELPTGTARGFARDAKRLVDEARRRIRDAFESESFATRRERVTKQLEHRVEEVLGELRRYAREHDLALELTPAGLLTLPLLDGKPLPPQQFELLPPERQHSYQIHLKEVESRVPAVMRRLRDLEREGQEQFRSIDREVAQFAAGHLVDELKQHWREVPRAETWLDAALEDMIENLPRFRSGEAPEAALPEPATDNLKRSREAFFGRYAANVLVTHEPQAGAPVVFAPNPTFAELFGRIEYQPTFGALSTDHSLVRAGAVHRANGGYLVLEALNVLTEPFVWRHLKEALRSKRVRIENMGAQYALFPTVTLEPEPTDLNLKVVLIGPPHLYRLLYMLDEDVRKLFKVKADFDVQMPWTGAEERQYAAFISRQVREEGLRHFESAAVARAVEEAARGIEDQERLSARFVDLANLVAEANHWAATAGSELVRADHIEAAIEHRVYRSNLVEERVRELIAEGTLLIAVAGTSIGQVNGLAVSRLGDHEFGHPTRVTATVSAGEGDLVNIDRESELSGPIHNKGFLILAGFLRERYSRDAPLSLKASLVFEQSYEQIEGDSAAAAELLALLSALADLPLRQDLAMTGSVNQHGRIQPVGAVNAKVEGFFEVCRERGLSGEQGVLVPRANVRNLMLKPAVVDAVRTGTFHVFAMETVEEALELLTGTPAGARQADGSFPEGTVNRRIENRLRAMAEAARRLHGGAAPDGSRKRTGAQPVDA
jgi:lon-related putative ATP-dependent protease